MNWIKDIQNAISYIEKNLLEDIDNESVANSIHSANSNFQRIFNMITGITIGQYIRYRRLSLAGIEVKNTEKPISDIYEKYRYETHESFTKAFTRFFGSAPSQVRSKNLSLKYFSPITITTIIKGGFDMNKKIIPNVPIINYDGNNTGLFITILESVLQSLGDSCDRAKLFAVSGEGNRFCWTNGNWVFGNEAIDAVNRYPFETEKLLLNTIGWKAKYVSILNDSDAKITESHIREDFINSINYGYPVIVRYKTHKDCNLNVVFGYEDNGEKIICYNFNNGFEAGISLPINVDTPVSYSNWEENIKEYIILQEKDIRLTERAIALSAFKKIVENFNNCNEINGKFIGKKAWLSFIDNLENEDLSFYKLSAEESPSINGQAFSMEHIFFIYCDALSQINARKEALPYYKKLISEYPEWKKELKTAIKALTACASYASYLWNIGFTFDKNGFEKFRSPKVRKKLAQNAQKAMMKDITAVNNLEKIYLRENNGILKI